jgi:hypothetical protein
VGARIVTRRDRLLRGRRGWSGLGELFEGVHWRGRECRKEKVLVLFREVHFVRLGGSGVLLLDVHHSTEGYGGWDAKLVMLLRLRDLGVGAYLSSFLNRKFGLSDLARLLRGGFRGSVRRLFLRFGFLMR